MGHPRMPSIPATLLSAPLTPIDREPLSRIVYGDDVADDPTIGDTVM